MARTRAMFTIGNKRKRMVPESDKTVSGDLTVDGSIDVTGVAHFSSVIHARSASRGIALTERSTVPAVTTNSAGIYNDDGTNSDCGLATIRATVDGTNWIDSAPRSATWTPSITDTSGDAFVETVNAATYWLMGPICHVTFYITWTGKGSTTGTDICRLSGFPFPNASKGRQYTPIIVSTSTTPVSLYGAMLDTQSYLRMTFMDSHTNVQIQDLATSGFFRGSFTYAIS